MTLARLPSSDETVRLYKAGDLASELARYHEMEGDHDPFIAQCITLHNKGDIDLVGISCEPAFAAIQAHNFFTAQHLYCEAIPQLNTTAAALMKCCCALIKQAGNDGAATQTNTAFRLWCVPNPEQAQIVVRQARDGDELAKEFVTFALQATNDVDAVIEFVRSFSDDRRVSGITALAGMNYADSATARAAVAILEPFVADDANDHIRVNALLAAFDVLKKHSDAAAARTLVETAAKDIGPSTLHGLAQCVWLHHAQLDNAALGTALQALRSVAEENLGTVRILDLALHRLLGTARAALALDYLTWKLRDGSLTLENFDATAHELMRANPQRLYELTVRWFLSGSIALCRNVSDLVGVDKERPFDTTAAPLGLTAVHQIFLCRKAIGYLFIKPVVCCSIIVSILRAADQKTAEVLADLLFDPILLNYGGDAKDYLKIISATDTAYPYIQRALAKEDAFHKGLDATGIIKELHPSGYQCDVVWQRTRDEMHQAHKLAEDKSVLIHLVHRSTMLYGKRSLTYVTDHDGNQRAIAMDLKSFGTSFELPRREILDPVGLDYMLRVFRAEKFK